MMHAGIKGSSPFMSDALMREESRPAPAPAAKAKRTEAGFNCAAHGLRGIAALMVFSAHLLGGSAEHVYQDHSAYVQFVLRPWPFGVYGVHLFFIISGFVILPPVLRYSPGHFALPRFRRLRRRPKGRKLALTARPTACAALRLLWSLAPICWVVRRNMSIRTIQPMSNSCSGHGSLASTASICFSPSAASSSCPACCAIPRGSSPCAASCVCIRCS